MEKECKVEYKKHRVKSCRQKDEGSSHDKSSYVDMQIDRSASISFSRIDE